MPRVQNLNTKTKEGKELHCNYAEKKEDIEMKKFIFGIILSGIGFIYSFFFYKCVI